MGASITRPFGQRVGYTFACTQTNSCRHPTSIESQVLIFQTKQGIEDFGYISYSYIICIVRNEFLAVKGFPLPKATSTGTTIVGCLFKDGVVLGADTRATSGDIVADKNCEKVRRG